MDRFTAELTPTQLEEWLAFTEVEPLVPERVDIASASLQAMQAELNRDRKARAEPFSPLEFLPRWETEAEREERLAEQQRRTVEAWEEIRKMDELVRQRSQ